AAASTEERSVRSAGTARHRTPSASTSRAVVASEPGSGEVSERATVDECSRPSPSSTVRAVTATSWPARARCTATALPIPRLAPVTNAVGTGAEGSDGSGRVPADLQRLLDRAAHDHGLLVEGQVGDHLGVGERVG